ncbi:Oidioi.mRNA.OKI2018_I69.chr1.g1585.t1.cds [Oikopleura dioica]|uniref:Oidioi.mRNA.OKI2018_I69.chr1.g1585.t1.cds n=1 Tax=Oikopleura dioica TaxID=34765 RepID=A0ABN7SND7_OIKDI|nr:Oidioi.mRNA.OKI2018_I69.chr1.g1585.t1.cds [Oikopleura dioica]
MAALAEPNIWLGYEVSEEERMMRRGVSPHHTNPRSATLDFWRKTSTIAEYKQIQQRRRTQMNIPTSSNHSKEEHMVIAHRLAAMEKRRIGTRFLEHDVRPEDMEKPLLEKLQESCSLM